MIENSYYLYDNVCNPIALVLKGDFSNYESHSEFKDEFKKCFHLEEGFYHEAKGQLTFMQSKSFPQYCYILCGMDFINVHFENHTDVNMVSMEKAKDMIKQFNLL